LICFVNAYNQEFRKKHKDVYERYAQMADDFRKLLWREELLALRDRSAEHRYPCEVLYNDYRQFLIKFPLGTFPKSENQDESNFREETANNEF